MMLQVPTTGFSGSVNKHNGKLDIQADWVEASAVFISDTVSRADVVEALIRNNSYRKQDFANEWTNNIFVELERRFTLLKNGGTLVREGNRVRRIRDWKEAPAYAFCVALSILPYYRAVIETACGKDYGEQGRLFEELTAETLRALHWKVEPVGWSKSAANSVKEKVDSLAHAIGEPTNQGAVKRWTSPHAKDGGLDLVIWKHFPDGWGGRPICLVQCASGVDWIDKLHTPGISTWKKLIDFATEPRRGLAMPFAPDADYFRIKSNSDLLMFLLDRHRLLTPSREQGAIFPSTALSKKLNAWTKKRVAALPTDET